MELSWPFSQSAFITISSAESAMFFAMDSACAPKRRAYADFRVHRDFEQVLEERRPIGDERLGDPCAGSAAERITAANISLSSLLDVWRLCLVPCRNSLRRAACCAATKEFSRRSRLGAVHSHFLVRGVFRVGRTAIIATMLMAILPAKAPNIEPPMARRPRSNSSGRYLLVRALVDGEHFAFAAEMPTYAPGCARPGEYAHVLLVSRLRLQDR